MASFRQHCDDCEEVLGNPCEDVNRWLDHFFRIYGAKHRFELHHDVGVRMAFEKFGELGMKAAMVHILKDCGHIPRIEDYPAAPALEFHNPLKPIHQNWLGYAPNFIGYWKQPAFIKKAKELVGQ